MVAVGGGTSSILAAVETKPRLGGRHSLHLPNVVPPKRQEREREGDRDAEKEGHESMRDGIKSATVD